MGHTVKHENDSLCPGTFKRDYSIDKIHSVCQKTDKYPSYLILEKINREFCCLLGKYQIRDRNILDFNFVMMMW